MRSGIFSVLLALSVSSAVWADPPVLTGLTPVTLTEDEAQTQFPRVFAAAEITATNPMANGRIEIIGVRTAQRFSVAGGEYGITMSTYFNEERIFSDEVRVGTGTRSGGVYRIDLNENATVEIAQAILRNITFYSNEDPPIEEYAVIVRVTDGQGEQSRDGERFAFDTASSDLEIDTGGGIVLAPQFADLDNDQDFDLVVGENGATFLYFENTGTRSSPAFAPRTGAANPFNGINHELRGRPGLADYDGDGDLDLVAGDHTGRLYFHRNEGTANSPAFVHLTGAADPFSGADYGDYTHPIPGDFDGDGDPDLLVGTLFDGVVYLRNDSANGNLVFTMVEGDGNPLGALRPSDYPGVAGVSYDIDGDSDQDLVFGINTGGGFFYFRNNGTLQDPDFGLVSPPDNPAMGIAGLDTVTVADLDDDGYPDLLANAGLNFHRGGLFPADYSLVIRIPSVNDAPRGLPPRNIRILEEAEPFDLTPAIRSQIRDPEGHDWNITAVDSSATLGIIELTTDFRLLYRPGPAFNYVARGQEVEDVFSFTVTDEFGASNDIPGSMLVGGENDPLVANDDAFSTSENAPNVVLDLVLLENDVDEDTNDILTFYEFEDDALLGDIYSVHCPEVSQYRICFVYETDGHFEFLALGETMRETIVYTASDTIGGGNGAYYATATAIATIIGENDAPVAADDTIGMLRDAPERDLTDLLLSNDIDVDNGAELSIVSATETDNGGLASVQNGRLYYTPPPAAVAPAEDPVSDGFSYTMTDQHGATSSARVTLDFLADGITATVGIGGGGTVTSQPAGVYCRSECSADFALGTQITFTAIPDDDTRFIGWSGACAAESSTVCTRLFNASGTVSAIFTGPVLRSAVLPAARSGALGGGDLTVFATVINASGGTASGCRIALGSGAPASLSYRAVDAGNNAVGASNPAFELGEGASASFVLAMSPQRATTGSGETVDIAFTCRNAAAEIIPSVNTVFLSIAETPVPDVIAIAATPTGDGSLRIASHGGRAAMGVAAVNIGAPADMTVSVDNGDAALPVDFTLCQTGTDGICLSPRTSSVTVNMAADPLLFSVLGVDADGEATSIPDDAANARAFLRFAGPDGVTRGLTSVGLVSGTPVSLDPVTDLLPVGRWSVSLYREGTTRFERGTMFVMPTGDAVLWTASGVYSADLSATNFNARRRNLTGEFADTSGNVSAVTGFWFPDRQLRMEFGGTSLDGEIAGVFDARSLVSEGTSISGLAGSYAVEGGGALTVGLDGNLSGTIGACAATGAALPVDSAASGVTGFSLTLSSCPGSTGSAGTAVIYRALDASRQPILYLLAAWPNEGFRLALTPSP